MPRNLMPPPYGIIADKLRLGRVVPFLGAGVNYGHRVPRNATWSAHGSPLLRADDIEDPGGLALRLKATDRVATYLRSKFSHRTQAMLAQYQENDPALISRLTTSLVNDLNRLSRAPYDPGFLESTGLPADMQRSLASLKGHALHRLSRQFLSDLFPTYIQPWEQRACNFLPDGAELSRFLAGRAGFTSPKDQDLTNLAKIASYLVEIDERRTLRDYLHHLLDRDYPPCPIHMYLAELSAELPEGVPLVIVTTNYDDLLERAFLQVRQERESRNRPSRPYDVVVHPTDRQDLAGSVLVWEQGTGTPRSGPPDKLYLDLQHRTILYKIHGTVIRSREGEESGIPVSKWDDSYVITEEDYVEFLSRMTYQSPVPAVLMRHLKRSQFLFLGYGLNDWNLRVLLHNIRGIPISERKKREGGTSDSTAEQPGDGTLKHKSGEDDKSAEKKDKSWAIQFRPSDVEKKLWEARKVSIFDVDINDFVTDLTAADPLMPGALR